MITCVIEYRIDPDKVEAFEHYARMWLRMMPRFGGKPHGYFLPAEGANDIALFLFDFPSLAEYETYRAAMMQDEEVAEAHAHARASGCIIRHERSFFRPLLPSS
ncbi:NIPSNAP family protein [Sphingobium sp. DC-2]|uniref:NIPSNAP family protein n=1 Tax=Sphingobium sp. DC-2 TaxID=1303256 RepID=UPI0004C2F574|nr:NIPSNAP family protein [Sphingobium sp. DC-2]